MTITITGAPKLTPAQVAALRAEQRRIDSTYPGQTVAYIDEWDGEVLRRTVVATAHGPAAFQQALAALDPETRRKAKMTRVPVPNVIDVPSVFLD
jgi:hypothetical protein